jgi:antitoxin component of RelBE/YafQ-DinJ toxin-antitoxin module
MAKAFKAFRLDPELYARFKELASRSGLTMTGAFEKFMEACVDAGAITLPTPNRRGVEAEARVLLAWLRKGKWLYDSPTGEREI